MTKKQNKMLIRIIVTFILFVVLMICEHTGMLDPIENTWILFVIYGFLMGFSVYFRSRRYVGRRHIRRQPRRRQ